MRVLLVQPPLTPNGAVEPPVGLAALAAWLVACGHTLQLLDLDLFQRLSRIAEWQACTREFEQVLDAFKPQVVGVTSMYSNSLHAVRLIAQAKALRPDIVTLAGGSHFGALPKESLARHPALDFVVQGEGERPLAEFLRRLDTDRDWSAVPALAWRRGEQIEINPPGAPIDPADLPDPWTTLEGILDPTDYLRTTNAAPGRRLAYVEAGRGCPFACTFCATAPFWQRRYRVKPVDRIVSEIRRLHEVGYDRFVLVHDLLTVNRSFIGSLCDALLDSRLPVEWMANARTDIPLDGLLPRMKAAGCWKLFFGIESASARLQAAMNKHLDPAAAISTVAELGRHGLTSTCSFVIGFPDETPAEASRSIHVGARMKVLGAEIVQFHRLRIWPPAALSEAGLAQTFDPVSLSIEYPYLQVPPDDLEEISNSPEFFAGYFTPSSSVGSHAQIAQLEMFAHHAVALAPLTIYALGHLRPGCLVSAFYDAIEQCGPLSRADLDWDGGHLMRNWETIAPYIAAVCELTDLSGPERSLVAGLLAYEDERVRFAGRIHNQIEDGTRVSRMSANIPEAIRRIQVDAPLDADLLRPTDVLFKRNADGSFSSFAAPA